MSLLALCGGCQADVPATERWDGGLRGDSVPPLPDQGVVLSCDELTPPAQPTVDPFPNPATQTRQPFRGQALGASQVVVQGPLGVMAPAPVGADGRFCTDVELIPGKTNALRFTPLDNNGCAGQQTQITVTQQPGEAGTPGSTDPVNVALGRPVESNHSPGSDKLAQVNDGDPDTYVELSFTDIEVGSYCNGNAWVKVELPALTMVTEVRLRWPQGVDDHWAKGYAIRLSDQLAPPAPDEDSGWTTVKKTCSASSGDKTIPIQPTAARWAAVLLYESKSGELMKEVFHLGELEVWGYDTTAPTVVEDHCP